MVLNYIKIALRNLYKNKLHSAINIFGLSLGLAVAVLTYLYVSNEFSYDRFHENIDRIFQAAHTRFEPDGTEEGYYVHAPIPFGPALEQEIPEIEAALRFSDQQTFVRSRQMVDEETVLMADRSFFQIFSFAFKFGTPQTSFNERYSVVLREELAQKYFGSSDPIGETLDVLLGEDYVPLTVSGVVEEFPSNSSIEFDVVVPYDLLNRYEWFRERQDSWNSWNSPTYVFLKENARIEEVETKMISFWDKYKGEDFAEQRASGEWTFDFQPIKTKFTPLKDVHHSPLKYRGIAQTSSPAYAFYLGAIALGILLIACINFMNLFISRSSNRTKEIAVRKVVGAERKNLVSQFLTEAVLVSLFAMVAAVLLVQLVLPSFSSMVGVDLGISSLGDLGTVGAVFLISLMAGVVAGIYPALLLSSFRPIQIFSHKLKFGGSNSFSKALIVFQFALTSFFLIGTLGVSKQLSFIQKKDLGFDKEQVVVIRCNYQSVDGDGVMEILKNEFRGDRAVAGISGISYSFNRGYDRVGYENSQGEERRAILYKIDYDFIDLMDMELAAGRNFDQAFSMDRRNAVIVNETLLEQYGMEQGVGERLDNFVNRGLDNPVIIGVVKDFHGTSLEEEIEPMIMHVNPAVDSINFVLAKLNPFEISAGLQKLEAEWNEVVPEVPFQYSFLDDDIDRQYGDAQLRQKVVGYSTGFAIFIAAIGLFGISSYSAERRKKEIGIRKVLGASVVSIMQLLGKKFVFLVGAANLIAWPLAYFVLRQWLGQFAYRADLGFGLFVLSGLVTLFLALSTLSYQVVRAALSDPVDSIRYE